MNWQPIETAPRAEGTSVLIWVEDGGYVVEAEYTKWQKCWRPTYAQKDDFYGDRIFPKFWMPLPEPPK